MVEIVVTSADTIGAYAGRDVINAPEIKRAIVERSRSRNDPPEIADWLSNHFFRHAIGNFVAAPPALQQIASLDQAQALHRPGAVPDWVATRLERQVQATGSGLSGTDGSTCALWWLEPASTPLLALEARLLEFLHSRLGGALEGKLERINCPQAIAQSAAEHAAFEAKTTAGWREHQPEAITPRLTTELGLFVELRSDSPLLRAEMAYESQIMRHCLGQFSQRRALTGGYGEQYASECEAGRLRLFSFRTGHQHPHITISAALTVNGVWRIDQIKGKQNRPPIARYRDVVRDFLNSLDTDETTPDDAIAIGLLRTTRGWQAAADVVDPREQLHITHRHPTLVRELVRPAPLVQWLIAARQPALLDNLPLLPEVSRALAGAGLK